MDERDDFGGAAAYKERIKQRLYSVGVAQRDAVNDETGILTPEQVNEATEAVWDELHAIGFFAGLD